METCWWRCLDVHQREYRCRQLDGTRWKARKVVDKLSNCGFAAAGRTDQCNGLALEQWRGKGLRTGKQLLRLSGDRGCVCKTVLEGLRFGSSGLGLFGLQKCGEGSSAFLETRRDRGERHYREKDSSGSAETSKIAHPECKKLYAIRAYERPTILISRQCALCCVDGLWQKGGETRSTSELRILISETTRSKEVQTERLRLMSPTGCKERKGKYTKADLMQRGEWRVLPMVGERELADSNQATAWQVWTGLTSLILGIRWKYKGHVVGINGYEDLGGMFHNLNETSCQHCSNQKEWSLVRGNTRQRHLKKKEKLGRIMIVRQGCLIFLVISLYDDSVSVGQTRPSQYTSQSGCMAQGVEKECGWWREQAADFSGHKMMMLAARSSAKMKVRVKTSGPVLATSVEAVEQRTISALKISAKSSPNHVRDSRSTCNKSFHKAAPGSQGCRLEDVLEKDGQVRKDVTKGVEVVDNESVELEDKENSANLLQQPSPPPAFFYNSSSPPWNSTLPSISSIPSFEDKQQPHAATAQVHEVENELRPRAVENAKNTSGVGNRNGGKLFAGLLSLWRHLALLTDRGFCLLEWDGVTCIVLVNAQDCIVAVLAGVPPSAEESGDWPTACPALKKLWLNVRRRARLLLKRNTILKGITARAAGISYGGGREAPGNV
ncbi:hypothetical protein BT96DRAFT_947375 [Gymnopus androsaceus JB14]|uniref:Uncharacterized protein n=1 Tax=Gymnopus androsaceus JB14 TaxID=1447944 RepID=A0A6A4GUB4_9AGAR|nr:hypothetical protein BT96DRAFT_947375 [Gymnopus androsaceus JB14]